MDHVGVTAVRHEAVDGPRSYPRIPRLLPLALSGLGWGVGVSALVIAATWPGMGADAGAYWGASRRLMDGEPLYQLSTIASPDAYFYPPLFAQLWTPLALLPLPAFIWVWRAVEFLALRYIAGSWRNMGLWLLFPLTLAELAHANVTFLVAAACMAAIRGRPEGIGWAGALKFGPLVLAPYVWLTGNRRGLMLGLVTVAVALLLSVAVSPAAWGEYVGAMFYSSRNGNVQPELIAILPSVGADFVLRFGLAVVACLVAARKGWPWLAYAAAVLAAPTLWMTRLVPLLALYRFARQAGPR